MGERVRTLKFFPDQPSRAGMERLTLTTGEVMVEVSRAMTARALEAVNCIFAAVALALWACKYDLKSLG